jgi:hypothetical protein
MSIGPGESDGNDRMERKIPNKAGAKEMIIWNCGMNERGVCIHPIQEKRSRHGLVADSSEIVTQCLRDILNKQRDKIKTSQVMEREIIRTMEIQIEIEILHLFL